MVAREPADRGGATFPDRMPSRVLDVLDDRFPEQAGGRAVAVFAVDRGRIDEGDPAVVVAATVDALDRLRGVRTVIGPVGPAAALLTSDDGRTAWAQIVFDDDAFDVPDEVLDEVVAAGDAATDEGLTVGFGGQPFERVESESTRTGEIIGLAVALVVLLVAFGSVGAAALPLLLAAVVVGIGYSTTRLLASYAEVNLAAQAMGSMIGLAVGIDYALFVVTRYRAVPGRGRGHDRGHRSFRRHRWPFGGVRRRHRDGVAPRPGRGPDPRGHEPRTGRVEHRGRGGGRLAHAPAGDAGAPRRAHRRLACAVHPAGLGGRTAPVPCR